jgi:hypothetical protein
MPPVTRANIVCHPFRSALAVAVLLAAAGPSLAQQPRMPDNRVVIDAAADLPADPECLTITQASAATYTISNSACPEQSVMAAIELAGGGSLARCFVKKIRTQISIASEGAAPVINYQCIEGAPGCAAEILRDMFPECHAG